MIEEHNWTRQRASLIIGGLIFLVGCLASLSMGPLNGLKIFGLVFFDLLFMDIQQPPFTYWRNVNSAIYIVDLGNRNVLNEVTNDGLLEFGLGNFWANVMLKYVAPALVFIVFLTGLSNILGLTTAPFKGAVF